MALLKYTKLVHYNYSVATMKQYNVAVSILAHISNNNNNNVNYY